MKTASTTASTNNNNQQQLHTTQKTSAGDSLAPLRNLRVEMRKLDARGSLDGYGQYLYGVVLNKLDLTSEATAALLKGNWWKQLRETGFEMACQLIFKHSTRCSTSKFYNLKFESKFMKFKFKSC